MNKKLITRCFAKAAESYEAEATVQRRVAVKMTSLLESFVSPEDCRVILEIGCGTGVFSRMLIDCLKPERMLLNDICPDMHAQLKDILNAHVLFESGDAETYPFKGTYDLAASCSAVQWFGDIDAFFSRICRLLTANGVLAFSTFGTDNMKEVASLTGKGLSYLSPQELTDKLSEQYDILHVSEETVPKKFKNPEEVLYHLKRTGVTGINQQKWTKTSLVRFCNDYKTHYGNGDGVILTYHPIYVVARKKRRTHR
ncbi:MAG: malonyl-ACP O-methyltransferase BioC [Tannerella sp.]|nr:malonyl-ACP O-methyltransferase BioC [Tannerella sp.]